MFDYGCSAKYAGSKWSRWWTKIQSDATTTSRHKYCIAFAQFMCFFRLPEGHFNQVKRLKNAGFGEITKCYWHTDRRDCCTRLNFKPWPSYICMCFDVQKEFHVRNYISQWVLQSWIFTKIIIQPLIAVAKFTLEEKQQTWREKWSRGGRGPNINRNETGGSHFFSMIGHRLAHVHQSK